MKPMTYSRAQIQFKGTHITSFIAAHANQSFILIVSLIGNLVLVRVTGNREKKYIENNHSTKFLNIHQDLLRTINFHVKLHYR